MTHRFELSRPERVTVGTVGPVGERVFLLQVRQDTQLVTIKVEKSQVAALAAYLGNMPRDLARPHDLPDGELMDLEPFDEPDFVAAAIGLSYDEGTDRVVLVIDELDRSDDDESDDPLEIELLVTDDSTASLAMTREQAAALAIRATELVEAGRPPCPLCGYPLDPRGHVCPRTNGNSAPVI